MIIELKTIEETQSSYDILEARLKRFFRDKLYIPLLKEINLPKNVIQNATDTSPLMDALFRGTISYYRGTFTGQLNAAISKELRDLGAKFDRKSGTYKLQATELPVQMKQLIAAQEANFDQKMKKLDKKLADVIPEELAKEFKCEDIFDKTLWKADKQFKKNVKNITVSPTLSDNARKRIADEWQNNMQLYIKDWTEEQIKTLRKNIYEHVTSGGRRDSLIQPILKVTKTIQQSHDEALDKARFLAQNETRQMMAVFKQARYEEAGSHGYIWRTVHRPKDASPKQHTPGNVRYSHGILDGKEFKWSDPPVITNPGQPVRKGHPGQDFNCRCMSRPLIRVNKIT